MVSSEIKMRMLAKECQADETYSLTGIFLRIVSEIHPMKNTIMVLLNTIFEDG